MAKMVAAIVLISVVLLTPGLASAQSNDVNQWGGMFSNYVDIHSYGDDPTQIQGLTGVTTLQTGNSDSYAIADGEVWAWGFGNQGELGDGMDVNSFAVPVKVKFPHRVSVVALGYTADAALAVDADGYGWTWGRNFHHLLCLDSNKNQSTPQRIPNLPGKLTAVAGGASDQLWLTSDGDVYACGEQRFGQLGIGNTNTEVHPVKVKGLPAHDPVVAISAGDFFSAALTQSGRLYMWGENNYGQLGIGTMTPDQTLPVRVPGTFTRMNCGGGSGDGTDPGSGHTLAITSAGVVEAWGYGPAGQLGNGQTSNEAAPVAVQVPNGVTVVKVAAAGVSSAAIDSNGNVWTWGSDFAGQLGNGMTGGKSLLPIEVDSGKTLLSGTANNLIDG